MNQDEQEKMIGADGLRLDDADAVEQWCQQQKTIHEKAEQEFAVLLDQHGVTADMVDNFDGDLNLDSLSGEAGKALQEMVNELEQRESNFQARLNKISSSADHNNKGGTGIDPASKWKKL